MALEQRTNVCRVCLQSDMVKAKKGLSLFEIYKDYLISELLNSIADVEIKKGDGLPSQICTDCLSELDAAVNFKIKCQTSNTILRKARNCNSETENPGIKIEYNLDDVKEEDKFETEYIDDFIDDDQILTFKTEENPSRAIDLKLICDDCGGSFPSKCKLRVHWKRTHLTQHLTCQICKRTFKSYRAFNRHSKMKFKSCIVMQNVNVQGLGKYRVYSCKECSYSTKRAKDMGVHLLLHSGEKPITCNLCARGFKQQNSLQDHMERIHKQYRVEITCQYCGTFVRGRNAAYKHLLRHTTAQVQCDVCKKFFKSKKILINHMVRHTGVKSLACEKCAKLFYTIAELCNHRRYAHDNKTVPDVWYKCPVCEYKSQKSYYVKRHQAKHTGSNFACSDCGRFFESAEKLVMHQPRHSEVEKKFPCPHCELRFMRRDSVLKHIKKKHKFSLFISRPVAVKREETPDKTIKVTKTEVKTK